MVNSTERTYLPPPRIPENYRTICHSPLVLHYDKVSMAIAPHTQNRQANLPLGSLQHKQILNEINYHIALYLKKFTNLRGQHLEISKEK